MHEITKYENTKKQRGLINQTLVDRRWGLEIQEQVDLPPSFFAFFVFRAFVIKCVTAGVHRWVLVNGSIGISLCPLW